MKAFFWKPAAAWIRYHDLAGSEPALVFIHGLGASAAQAFVDVTRRPPLDGRRCVLPDLLGFGHSDHPTSFSYSIEDHAASVAALLDAFGLQGVVLVGHSMGGAVAIVLAKARPDLVSRLVLAEGHLDPEPGSVTGPVVAHSEADFTRHEHAALVHALVTQGLASYAGAFQVADPVGVHRSATSLIAPRHPTFREMLAGLPVPRVFLLGGLSTPNSDLAWLPRHGVPVRVVPGAGHDMMNDRPDEFAAEVGASLA